MLIDSIRGMEAYPRGDYKKLLDLIEAYIGLSEGRFQFLGCRAVHKARWMGKQLYCYKMAMLQEYIPQGIASKSPLQKIFRVVDFCTVVFNLWLNCPLAASAPHQDLELDNNIKSFANVDPVVSAAALKAFSRHTWYLSGELIPLALWDEDVTYEEKNLLADSINASQCSTSSASMEFTKRYGNEFGKPELPDVTAGQHLSLSQFATADSTMLLRILSIPSAFLAKPATQ